MTVSIQQKIRGILPDPFHPIQCQKCGVAFMINEGSVVTGFIVDYAWCNTCLKKATLKHKKKGDNDGVTNPTIRS